MLVVNLLPSDGGLYECVTDLAPPATVRVRVEEEQEEEDDKGDDVTTSFLSR